MSGTPFAVDAMKRKDISSMMAGMAYSRQLYARSGNQARLTRYFAGGTYFACEAALTTSSERAAAMRSVIIASLGLSQQTKPSARVSEFAKQYMVSGLSEAFEKDGTVFVIHYGAETDPAPPASARAALSVLVF